MTGNISAPYATIAVIIFIKFLSHDRLTVEVLITTLQFIGRQNRDTLFESSRSMGTFNQDRRRDDDENAHKGNRCHRFVIHISRFFCCLSYIFSHLKYFSFYPRH